MENPFAFSFAIQTRFKQILQQVALPNRPILLADPSNGSTQIHSADNFDSLMRNRSKIARFSPLANVCIHKSLGRCFSPSSRPELSFGTS
jgi:hypothetical protein